MTSLSVRDGERLVRVHRFRLTWARGCAVSTTDIVVEENLGAVPDATTRCQARPDHPSRVPRPHVHARAETVEGALAACIEKMRESGATDFFFPQA
jgi:hypothetical protein